MLLAALSLVGTLLAPPAPDTTRYVVLNHGRPAGDMIVVRDGATALVRYIYVDRNRGQRVQSHYRFGASGTPVAVEVRPVGADGTAGDVQFQFEVRGDSARFSGGGGRGGRGGTASSGTTLRFESGMFPRLGASTPFDLTLLARHLLRQPQRTARLFPTGTARLEVVAETTLTVQGRRERLRLAMVHAGGAVPNGVWLDDRDELFASEVAWFITARPEAQALLPALRAFEVRYRNAHAEALAKPLIPAPVPALVIRNGDLFDSERLDVRPRTTVVVRGERIVAVGPADSVPVPAGATVIDATGKTIVPGLWDMHGHFQLTSQSSGAVMQLANGITTVRDLAADTDVGVLHRDRASAGKIVAPRAILAGFMEGPGAWAGPSDVLVRTEAEARAWVARYDSLGYRQIKLYNLVHPDLVPTIAAETERRGMILSGHIPRGLSVPAAVELGFDEINHAAFLFSTFFPDSLFWPQMRAYSAVASAVAPNFDVDSPPMTALIDLLRRKRTVIDGTFNLWMGGGALTGQGNPGAAQYARLLKRLYDAGVPIVAGTDNSAGTTFVLELELYQHSGIPAPNVLQIATLGAARVMKDDRDYGSIAVGKVADLLVVNGRPYERVSDLRRLERVVRAGRAYDPAALRAALERTP